MRTLVLASIGFALGCRPDASTPASYPATEPRSELIADAPVDADSRPDPAVLADAAVEATNTELIACVLAEPQLAHYVHPELTERLPVKLHLPTGVRLAALPIAFGAPIELVDASAALVDVHGIFRTATAATVKISIEREGMVGAVECVHAADGWKLGSVHIVEH